MSGYFFPGPKNTPKVSLVFFFYEQTLCTTCHFLIPDKIKTSFAHPRRSTRASSTFDRWFLAHTSTNNNSSSGNIYHRFFDWF
jgi:hypothetical protein